MPVPISPSTLRDPSNDFINDPIKSREVSTNDGNLKYPDLISDNPNTPLARRKRQTIRWRVPGLGFVDMYVNPQSLIITERKIIQRQRTKGGYIIQYWGEELASIRIEGTTGSSGIEGINVLRKVYRAEQDAFEQVAQTLADRLGTFSVGKNLGSAVGAHTLESAGQTVGSTMGALFGAGPTPPLLPTLGSLAASVELFYQGWVFKGYFEDFVITESVSNGVGIFNYQMTFLVTDRRGIRNNYMPFHRSPADFDAAGTPLGYRNSDSSSVPMNFGGEE